MASLELYRYLLIALGALALAGLVFTLRTKQNPKVERADDSAVGDLCQMVDLRRRFDRRLRRKARAANSMTIGQLWMAPEGQILSSVTTAAWLQDGGMTEAEAWAHICPSARDEILAATDAGVARRIGVASILRIVDPRYLALGQNVIDPVVEIARARAIKEVQQTKSGSPYPPLECLGPKVSLATFKDETFGNSSYAYTATGRAAVDIRDRFMPGDEVRRFGVGGGRMQGFALVRRGRPIAHVITLRIHIA